MKLLLKKYKLAIGILVLVLVWFVWLRVMFAQNFETISIEKVKSRAYFEELARSLKEPHHKDTICAPY
jgi:hypothetical protein